MVEQKVDLKVGPMELIKVLTWVEKSVVSSVEMTVL